MYGLTRLMSAIACGAAMKIGNIPARNTPERFRELRTCVVSGMHFRPEWSSAWPFSMVSQAFNLALRLLR